jgi:drug/metabolite transporter (DMT)-like permease
MRGVITGRHVAAAFLAASGVFVLAMGGFGILQQRLTVREGLAGTAGLVVAAVSWLWLRRDKRDGGTS